MQVQHSDKQPEGQAKAKPFIQFESVTKSFGQFTALNNISLDIYQGEFFALLGPSGCGKTTLMRLIAGFEEVSSGRLLLDGEDISGIPPNRRPVNMMFQSYALFPHMSVAKNIGFGLKQDGWCARDIADRVEEMLSLVQLDHLGGRKPHQLSGGQRQRVALARSLAKKPKVLLLDEPLAALDKKLREQTQFELGNIQCQLGLTFIIVTHDQEEAMTVADRIAVMKAGEIHQVATPTEIYEHPENSFVADFVGNVNLIDVTVRDNSNELVQLDWSAKGPPLVMRHKDHASVPQGAAMKLVLRPEKIVISKEAPEQADNINRLQGSVEEISYTGSTSSYLVKLDSGAIIRVLDTNRTLAERREITWGDRVWLSWRAGSSVLVKD